MSNELEHYRAWRGQQGAAKPLRLEDYRQGGQGTPAPQQTTPTTPVDERDSYAAWRQNQTEQVANRAAVLSEAYADTDPNDVTSALRLQQTVREQTGYDIPADLLDGKLPELQRQIERDQLRSQLARSPRLSGWMSQDPTNAILGRSEAGELSALESILTRAVEGVDRFATGTPKALRRRRLTAVLEDATNAREDSKRTFTEIMADIEAAENGDIPGTRAIRVARDTLTGVSRFASSRVRRAMDALGGAESFDESIAALSKDIDGILLGQSENEERLEMTYGTNKAIADFELLVADASGRETVGEQLGAFWDATKNNPKAFGGWLVSVVAESAVPLAAGALTTVVTRNPAAGAAVAGLGGQALASEAAQRSLIQDMGYDMSKPEDRAALVSDPRLLSRLNDRAFVYGTVIGLVDGLSGGIASSSLARSPLGELMLQGLTQAAMGSGGETLALLASEQELSVIDIIVEGLAEFVTVPVEVAGVGGQSLRANVRRAQQAREDAAFFNALASGSENSELRANVPEKYRGAIAALTENGAVENLYVKAYTLQELFQSGSLTVDALTAAVPGLTREQIEQAALTGGDIVIPTAAYATGFVGSPLDAALRQHLRTRVDGMSAAEAKAFEAEAGERMGEVRKMVEEVTSGQRALEQRAEDARVELVGQLRRAGRAPQVAEREALQAVAVASTFAQRTGTTFEAFIERYPLARVAGAFDGDAPVARVDDVMMARLRAPQEGDADNAALAAVREAAEVVGLDLQTATAVDLERALTEVYGPAAGPTLLRQSATRTELADDTIIGPDGQPVKLYHGTNRSFSSFTDGRIFLTTQRGLANEHAMREGLRGARLIEANAALSNPLVIEIESGGEPDAHWLQNTMAIERDLEAGGHDGVMVYNPEGDLMVIALRDDQVTQLNARPENFNQSANTGVLDAQDTQTDDGRGARQESGSQAPLPGAPNVEGASGPDPRLTRVAEDYARSIGKSFPRQAEFVTVDPAFATRIADAYAAMEHNPQDMDVRLAYAQLIEQTTAQYRALEAAGYQFWFFDENTDPYAGNPWNAMRDLRANQKMAVFATEAGFGSGDTDLDVSDNPLMSDTGIEWSYGAPDGPKKRVLANDLFRAVHDAFGHGLEGAGFRARGEENAWQAHARLFTGRALGALTSETRGQNSWLNYGPHGEKNRTAGVEDTIFADQKTGLMPSWTWTENIAAAEYPIPVNADGTITLVHWSDAPRDVIDPAKAGTGPLAGRERNRRGPQKSFFGAAVGTPIGYRKERLGPYRHEARVQATDLYDFTADPLGFLSNIPDDVLPMQRIGWVEEQIQAAGFKGYIVADSPLGATAVLYEAVTPETVIDDRTLELYQSGANPDFFSALTREVENAKQAKAGAKDWKAIISKLPGIKKAEIEWSGVNEWLDSQTGQIAREDVAAFLRDNEVEVEAIVLSGVGDGEGIGTFTLADEQVVEPDTYYLEQEADDIYLPDLVEQKIEELREEAEADGEEFNISDLDELDEAFPRIAQQLRDDAYQMAEERYYEEPEYSYTVYAESPDGDTVAYPVHRDQFGEYYAWEGNSYLDEGDVIDAIREHHADQYGESNERTKWEAHTEDGRTQTDYREVLLTVPSLEDRGPNAQFRAEPFVNSYHYDQPNIVVHARLNYREGAQGEKVMFVEEAQSDLGSFWRDNPNARPEPHDEAAFEAALAANTAAIAERQALVTVHREKTDVLHDELAQYGVEKRAGMHVIAAHMVETGLSAEGAVNARSEALGLYNRGPTEEHYAAMERVSDAVAADPALADMLLDFSERQRELRRAVQRQEDAESALRDLRRSSDLQEPMTPFEGEAYYALMMKKLLKLAAEEGADKLAWTPAYMQARRWSGMVQNVVQEIAWDKGTQYTAVAEDGTTQDAFLVALRGVNGSDDFLISSEGIILEKASNGGRIPEADVAGRGLAYLLGGTMANRIMAEDGGSITGQNIVVGGEGFKIAYDQQIKKFVEKFARKYGGQLTVDKTMPDFVRGLDSDGTMKVAGQLGFVNVVEKLQASTRDPAFWEQLIRRQDAQIADLRTESVAAIAENEAEMARLDAAISELSEPGGPDDSARMLLTSKLRHLVDMTNSRREALRKFDDPEAYAATLLRRVLVDLHLTPTQIAEAIPEMPQPEGDAVWSVEITPEMRTAAMEAQPLFQRRPDGARGSILLPTEPGREPLVTLYEKADLSTFLHESGHYYLHILQDLVARGDAPESMVADWETIKRWWAENLDGVAADGGVTRAQVERYLSRGTTGDVEIDRKINVGMQEQWARAFEAYLLEGKAPSNALRAAFESFSAWLLAVYRNARNLNVTINDDLRGVFDRLMATDAEIAKARDTHSIDAIMASSAEAMGISPEEYAAITKISLEAQDEAKQRLQASMMAPIRAQLKADYKIAYESTYEEVAKVVNAKPANRVREWLGNNRWLGDDGAPAGLPDSLRINKQSLIDDYGPEIVQQLPRGKFPLWVTDANAPTADEVAGWFGFRSGDEMLQALLTTPRAADETKAKTEARMRAEYGDQDITATAAEQAVDALHGEKRGQLIAAELRALARNASRAIPRTTRTAAAEIARRMIRSMPIRQATRSGTYLAAERRASERSAQALAKGDFDTAYDAKRQQLINYALYNESRKADDLVARAERKVAQLQRKGTRKALAGDYLGAIDELLERYDFRRTTAKAERHRGKVAAYVKFMTEQGRANELAIPEKVLNDTKRVPYKQLSVQELEGVLAALTNIEHTARLKKKLQDARDKRDFDAVVDGIVEEMDRNLPDNPPPRTQSSGSRAKKNAREFLNLLLNADTLLRKIGGFDRGFAYDAIKQPIDEAMNWATEARVAAAEALENLYSVYSRKDMHRMSTKRAHPELNGDRLSRWDLISAALNMGNADNLSRLMDKDSGRGYTTAQVDYIKNQLDARDWAFVQSVWDYIDTYWPLIEAREKRATGVAPPKVAPAEVTIPTQREPLRGGYYPIKYDSDLKGIVAAEELADIMKNMQAGHYGKAQTRNGHTKERANGSGGRVLQLGMEVLHQHIGQVIHDLALSESVNNSYRVLQDPRVVAAFERKGLLKDKQALELWLQDVASNQLSGGGVLGRFMLRVKSGFTISKLAFNMSTVMVQLTGIPQSMVVIGKKNFALGMSDYMSDPVRRLAEIKEVSSFMRERETTFHRDINDLMGDITQGPAGSAFDRWSQSVGRVGFWLMQKVQYYSVDVPTWLGAYRQGLAKFGNDENKARMHADRMVARAQASGLISDRSAFERGTLSTDTRQNGFVRLFTALGSYMFAKGNIAYERLGVAKQDIDGFNGKSFNAAFSATFDVALLFTIEAVIYGLIKGTLPGMGDDDDEEAWAAFLAKETALSMLATVPVGRDVASSLSGFEGGAYGSVIDTFTAPVIQAAQGEIDQALIRAISNAAGVAFGLPSSQLNRIVDGIWRIEEGEDVAPIEFLMGRR